MISAAAGRGERPRSPPAIFSPGTVNAFLMETDLPQRSLFVAAQHLESSVALFGWLLLRDTCSGYEVAINLNRDFGVTSRDKCLTVW